MGADVVRGLRRAPHPVKHQSVLCELHREPHHPRNWGRPAGQADHHSDPTVLQRPPKEWTGSAQKLPAAERCQSQPQSGAGRPHAAAQLPGAGGGGAPAPRQPRPGLQAAAVGKERNEDPAARENRPVSCRSGKTRIAGRFLSGTDHRPAERGTAGPPMDGLGCGEQNAFRHQAGKSNQRGTGGQSAENSQLRANAGSPSAGSRPADCRAQKAHSQSVYVSIAQDRNHV